MPPADACANPLLLEWVHEWLETARERNTKGVTVYKKAYDSLKSCPLPFSHPSEAQQLHGFGPKLCGRLTDKLKKHCEENSLPMPQMPYKAKKTATGAETDEPGPVKKARKVKAYVPTLRSGPYALILGLASISEEAQTGLTKAELIEVAQPHCDSSFTAPSDPTKFYTAWNSMKTLVDKDLVYEKGRPLRKYALTEEGWEVAKRIKDTLPPDETAQGQPEQLEPPGMNDGLSRIQQLERELQEAREQLRRRDPVAMEASNDDEEDYVDLLSSPERGGSVRAKAPIIPDVVPIGEMISEESSLPTFSPLIVKPGAFSVELVLDVREIRATKDRDYMQNELIKKGMNPIMRALELGDCLWVAKCKDPKLLTQLGAEGDEIVLDWVVERKRLDDLVGSIKDGRFHEQKFRLRKSGIKNVVYIIEEISMNADHFQKYEEAVESAIASTQVVNGYFVKKTQKMDDTIRYLARMTVLLKNIYESKPLYVVPTKVLTTQNYLALLASLGKKQPDTNFNITYPAFASLASKSEALTLRDVYLKMLMCTRGVTGEKALEIQRRWKTPQEFVKSFAACGSGEEGRKRKRELVVGKMGNLVGRKKIAKQLSSKIAEVWGDVDV